MARICRPFRWVVGMVVGLGILPGSAAAHTGTAVDALGAHGLIAGFSHPFSGLDHLLAMIAVGLWAAQLGGRARWLVPTAFVGAMILGSVLGVMGVAVPWGEQGILASVLILGLLVAAAVRLPLAASALLAGALALCHGHAHGAEMPALVAGLGYGAGFTVATAGLQVLGIGLGGALQRLRRTSRVDHAGRRIPPRGEFAPCGFKGSDSRDRVHIFPE